MTEPPEAGLTASQAVALTVATCLTVTLLLHVADVGVIEFDDLREGQLETAAAMVLVFVGAVLLGRFRLYGSRRDLLLVASLFVLAVDNLLSTFLTTAADSLSRSGFATWAAAASGALGGIVLAAAAVLPDRPIRRRNRAALAALLASATTMAVIVGLAAALGDSLPSAFESLPQSADEMQLLNAHPLLVAVEAATALCYGLAAVVFARLSEATDDHFMRWLGIGAAIAGVAFVNYTLFPSEFTELLYAGDLFLLAAVLVLLIGAVREISNVEAAHLRSAVLEERKRVARHLDDGVVKELAYVSAQTELFVDGAGTGPPLGKILDSVERALEESRGTIAALNRPFDEPFDVALGHAARDVADRVGARLQLDLDRNVGLSADWRDALLRIAREAVGNAVRHGHARTVTLRLRNGDAVRLQVRDDGDGFDVHAFVSAQSSGLTSMRERTKSLGGQFSIESAPGAGTTVEVVVP